jgi:hypothetical protein
MPVFGAFDQFVDDPETILGVEVGVVPISVRTETSSFLDDLETFFLCFLKGSIHIFDQDAKVLYAIAVIPDEIGVDVMPILDLDQFDASWTQVGESDPEGMIHIPAIVTDQLQHGALVSVKVPGSNSKNLPVVMHCKIQVFDHDGNLGNAIG